MSLWLQIQILLTTPRAQLVALSDGDMCCRVLLSLVGVHDRRCIRDRPGAALMAPLCGAILGICQAVCLGTLARQLMTPAGISGTGLAEVVHVVTDFVLKWSSETIACIAGHAKFSCPPSLPRNLSSLFFQMECILPVVCVSIEKTKNTSMQIAILQSMLKSGLKSGLKPTARLIPPHSDLISDLKKQVRHQVRNFSWAHPTIFRT